MNKSFMSNSIIMLKVDYW